MQLCQINCFSFKVFTRRFSCLEIFYVLVNANGDNSSIFIQFLEASKVIWITNNDGIITPLTCDCLHLLIMHRQNTLKTTNDHNLIFPQLLNRINWQTLCLYQSSIENSINISIKNGNFDLIFCLIRLKV